MGYLVRRISEDIWGGLVDLDQPLPSDVLGDLKTTENKLSVWYAANDTEIEKAELAILASLKNLEPVTFIRVPVEAINSLDLEINSDHEGDTPLKDLRSLHRDIVIVHSENLVRLAKLFREIYIRSVNVERLSPIGIDSIVQKIQDGFKIHQVSLDQGSDLRSYQNVAVMERILKNLGVNIPKEPTCKECKKPTKKNGKLEILIPLLKENAIPAVK